MSNLSPSRPSRRAATQRRVVLDESDEENQFAKDEEDEDEFTPAPQRSPRRANRRKTTEPPATPRSVAKTRYTKTHKGIEPSQIFQVESSALDPVSPTKRISPRKRKSSVAPQKPQGPTVPKEVPTLSTQILIEKEEEIQPLNDVTRTIVNEQAVRPSSQNESVPLKAKEAVLEKPMDIVIRSRALPAPILEDIGPRARTVIKNLILVNFKSYAGRQEVGPFHASFSSVVGPNGSGKSNVIDSLLFVFGFRASKMRQGKISALIHNSAAFPDLEYCEVEVHFQEVMDKVKLHILRVSQKAGVADSS